MKAITCMLLFIITLFYVCQGSNKTFSNPSIKNPEKEINFLSNHLNSNKSLKFMNQDNPEDIINLIGGALFVSGASLYFINRSSDSRKQNRYVYKNVGLILMGVSIGGGFMSLYSSANDSDNFQYGPRSSLNKSKNIQLSLNGEGFGLKFNF